MFPDCDESSSAISTVRFLMRDDVVALPYTGTYRGTVPV
jgi:hypothetical protein